MDLHKLNRVAAACLMTAAVAWGDTIVLQNGSRLSGSYLGGDSRSIRFAVGSRVNTYALADVSSLSFDPNTGPGPSASGMPGPNAPSAPYPPNPSTNQQPYGQQQPVYAPPTPMPPQGAAPVSGMSIPAGSQLVVRLIDGVNSETDSLGQTYRASLDQPVVVDGQTVIPRGADVLATLIDAQKSGRIQGKTVLTLDLKSVTVNGRTYDIVTTGVSQASSSRGARSAKVIGGTTALGAIIGGIAGGGRGAAIGAGSGAAVGTAAEVATSGQKVKVPSETRLTFTLQNPLAL